MAMTPLDDSLKTRIPLSSEAHAAAEQAYQQQAPKDRKQTYLNILAVHAAQEYLQWLSIPCQWEGCDSQDPVMRKFLNVADLEVLDYGRLECRPVLPDGPILEIPSEVRGDRLGYIAVQFDEDLETATLLGFTPTAGNGSIPLTDLEPLDALLDMVGTAPDAPVPTLEVSEDLLNWREPVHLGQWLGHKVTATVSDWVATGWHTLEELEHFLAPEARMELAFSVRSTAAVAPPPAAVRRGKLLDLPHSLGGPRSGEGTLAMRGIEKGGEQVALVVGLNPGASPDTEISVEVYPTGTQPYLPKDLELMVLDESGDAVMQAQSRSNKKIQMEFSGETGEQFSIKLALGEFSVTEAFLL
jgi:hypothetical protein